MLEISNLTFSYKPHHMLFSDFSLHLEKGKVCGLLGPNGVGKSTLLYLICGLLPTKKGTISYKGMNTFSRQPEMLNDMFLVPEELELPKISMERFVSIHSPFYPKFSAEELQKALTLFEINPQQKLSDLSMGQKKKFYISFAMATGVSLLVMDEPTNGIDIPGKSQFRQLLAQGMSEERSILISTHQVADIDKMLDQIVILSEKEGLLLNESVSRLCQKLQFLAEGTEEEAKEALYVQNSIAGRSMVRPNYTGAESELNIELLFGAALHNSEKLRLLLQENESEINKPE